ncbi:MAG: helix-turn-helix transcriptional regulator [Sedimentisphaerales bacterium]
MKKTDFAEQLRKFREQAGISQSELARRAKLNPSHLNRVESGERNPPRRATVKVIAEALSLLPAEADKLLLAAGYVGYESNKLSGAIFNAPEVNFPALSEQKKKQATSPSGEDGAQFLLKALSSANIPESTKRLLVRQICSFTTWLISEASKQEETIKKPKPE